MSAPTTEIVIPYRPRPQQQAVHRAIATKRFAVLVTHRRFGKTVLAVNHQIRGALTCRKPRPRYGFIAPTYTQGKATAFDYLTHYSEPIPQRRVNQSELRVDYPNGGQVRLYGADNPDSLRGLYFDGVVLDEYGLHPAKTFSEVIGPTLVDRGGTALFLGTPNGKNQFYDIAQHAQREQAQGNPDWYYAEYKASDTGLLDATYLAAARAVMTSDEYAQEFECFPAGTLIATARGHLPIETVRTSDTVLTHRTRWRPVITTMQRPYTGDLIEIQAYGPQAALRCTPTHPILVYEKAHQSRAWKPAADVQPGECLILPKVKSCAPSVSADWAALIAWFVCEGSVTGNSVAFSLNPHNQAEIDALAALLTRLGYTPVWSKGNLYVCCVVLADRLVSWCGSGAPHKRLPFDVINGHEALVLAELLKGDGCASEPIQGGHCDLFTTTSEGLAYDVHLLAAAVGKRSSITRRPGGPGVIEGRAVMTRDSYCVRLSRGFKVNHGSIRQAFPTKYGIAYRVKTVQRTPFDGVVYNLSVKGDQSYVANGRAVHNCSFEASVKGAIYAKELEAARRDGRLTDVPADPLLPVDTDWDLGIGDAMAIWFSQTVKGSGQVRLIDYYEASGEGFPHYLQVLRERRYTYGTHWAPHDIAVRELGSGKSRLEVAAALGLRFSVTPRVSSGTAQELEEGIHAVRLFLPRCWIDQTRCRRGVEALGQYRRDYNSRLDEFKATPVHDHASHAADALRGLAVRHRQPPERAEFAAGPRPTSWMG